MTLVCSSTIWLGLSCRRRELQLKLQKPHFDLKEDEFAKEEARWKAALTKMKEMKPEEAKLLGLKADHVVWQQEQKKKVDQTISKREAEVKAREVERLNNQKLRIEEESQKVQREEAAIQKKQNAKAAKIAKKKARKAAAQAGGGGVDLTSSTAAASASEANRRRSDAEREEHRRRKAERARKRAFKEEKTRGLTNSSASTLHRQFGDSSYQNSSMLSAADQTAGSMDETNQLLSQQRPMSDGAANDDGSEEDSMTVVLLESAQLTVRVMEATDLRLVQPDNAPPNAFAEVSLLGTASVPSQETEVDPLSDDNIHQTLQSAFAKIDANGDGGITSKEIMAAVRADASLGMLLGLEEHEQGDDQVFALGRIFQQMDVDGDHTIDLAEFLRYFGKTAQPTAAANGTGTAAASAGADVTTADDANNVPHLLGSKVTPIFAASTMPSWADEFGSQAELSFPLTSVEGSLVLQVQLWHSPDRVKLGSVKIDLNDLQQRRREDLLDGAHHESWRILTEVEADGSSVSYGRVLLGIRLGGRKGGLDTRKFKPREAHKILMQPVCFRLMPFSSVLNRFSRPHCGACRRNVWRSKTSNMGCVAMTGRSPCHWRRISTPLRAAATAVA